MEFKVGRARGLPPGRVAGRVAGGAAEVVVEVSSPSEEYSSEDEDKFAATSASEGFFVGRVGRCARCGRRDIESNSNETCYTARCIQNSRRCTPQVRLCDGLVERTPNPHSLLVVRINTYGGRV